MGWFGPQGDCGCCTLSCGGCNESKAINEGNFTDVNFENGSSSLGPLIHISKAEELYCGGSPSSNPSFTLNAVPDSSETIDFINPGCTFSAVYNQCLSGGAFSVYQICNDGCASGQIRGVFLIADALLGANCPSGPPQEYPMISVGANVEWFCVDNVPYYVLTVQVGYVLFERKPPSGGSCVYAPTSQPADGSGYSWSTTPETFGDRYTATRDDGLAQISIAYANNFGLVCRKIFAVTQIINTPSVDLWNAAYNPLGLLQGRATLT